MRKNHIAGVAPSKQAAKKPRKNTANKLSVDGTESSSTGTDAGQKKSRGGGSKRAPAKKQQTVEESDEEEEILALKDRLAAYNLDSSPDHGAMETDTLVVDQEKPKKQPSRNAAAKKATYAVLSDDEDDEPEHHLMPTIDELEDDDDFSINEEVPKSVKGKGRKPRNETAATRKRGSTQAASKANSQKPNTNVQPAARVSPEKKLRKMRASPFNKKSGSVLSRLTSSPSASEDSGGSNIAAAIDEVAAAVTGRTRPKRDNRTKAIYVESDSEGEDEVEDDGTEDSDFQED